jgi:hypothetical protein
MIMNKLGYMRGSKETAKGRQAEKKHRSDQRIGGLGRTYGSTKKKA